MTISLITTKALYAQAIFTNLFMEGGPLFMTMILICLLASLVFVIRGFILSKSSSKTAQKMLKLTVDSSLLGLVLGFLGSVIGLISAFDSIEAFGNPSPEMFAGGLKISLLTATFGLFSFAIARIGIFILRLMLPAEDISE